MSVEYRGDNKYRFRVRKDGINYTQNFFSDKTISEKDIEDKKYPKEVIDAHKKFEVDIMSGNVGMNENMKYIDLSQLVLDEYIKANLRISTQQLYIALSNNYILPYFGDMKLSKIKAIHVQKFINDLTNSYTPLTIKAIYSQLNKTFNKAIQWDIIKVNPCKNIALPKVKRTNYKELLSKDEIVMLKNAINKQDLMYRTIFSIALFSGMRQAEILALKKSDIDFAESTINISKQYGKVFNDEGKITRSSTDTKTDNSIRNIYIPNFLNSLIETYINSIKIIPADGTLFYNPNTKKPYTRESITRRFRYMLKENDIPSIRFHDLRHLYATMAINSGINVVAVARTLGDTIETVLNNYTHGIEDEQKKAAHTFEEYIDNL